MYLEFLNCASFVGYSSPAGSHKRPVGQLVPQKYLLTFYLCSDTLRRHYQTCLKRGSQSTPDERERRLPRRACDYCALTKIACDNESPCESCLIRGQDCSYQRVGASPKSIVPVSSRPLLVDVQPSDQSLSNPDAADEQSSHPTHGNIAIQFLLNYTDPASETILDFRNNLESSGWMGAAGDLSDEVHVISLPKDVELPWLSEDDLLYASDFYLPIRMLDMPEQSGRRLWSEDQIDEILGDRRLALSNKLRSCDKAPQEDSVSEEMISSLLAVENMRVSLESFICRMHPYNAQIHMPTFRLQETALDLLLVMVVAGSIYSYPRDTHYTALQCLDLVENIIFDGTAFDVLRQPATAGDPVDSALIDTLNAAIVIVYLQLGMKDDSKRWRVRNQRFPDMVSAARNLTLFSVGHPKTNHSSFSDVDWRTWSTIEAQKR